MQPNGLFYWFDVLGVTDMRSVIPNLGPDNYQDIQTMGYFEEVPEVNGKSYSVVHGQKLRKIKTVHQLIHRRNHGVDPALHGIGKAGIRKESEG